MKVVELSLKPLLCNNLVGKITATWRCGIVAGGCVHILYKNLKMMDLTFKSFLCDSVIGESPPHWDAWEMEGGCVHTGKKTFLRSDVIWKWLTCHSLDRWITTTLRWCLRNESVQTAAIMCTQIREHWPSSIVLLLCICAIIDHKFAMAQWLLNIILHFCRDVDPLLFPLSLNSFWDTT